jgi:hypothetical protein
MISVSPACQGRSRWAVVDDGQVRAAGHRRRQLDRVDLVDPAGQRPGQRALAGPDVQDPARPVRDDLLEGVEHLGRVRRPVPVRIRHPRVPEDRGELIPAGLLLLHEPR